MPDRVAAFAPGRVNLIGEHTDYNGGLALPFAISDGVTVRAQQLSATRVQVVATDLGETDEFALHEPSPAEGWRAFVRGVVAELQRDGVELPGAGIEISGTVPRGSGLSSSAALEVALALALVGLAGVPEPDRRALARMCSRVETRWVGAQTGLLDQLASLFGRERHALRIDFRSLEVTPVALELGTHRVVTLDSGEQHAHAVSGYNQRRRECEEACRRLGLDSLREASLPMARTLPDPLARRAEHVISENARVQEAVLALLRGDLNRLGELLNASHASLRDHYEISTPAVEEAVARLRAAGATGARIIGGGFGGNVLGLLPGGAAAPMRSTEVRPAPGAHLLAQ